MTDYKSHWDAWEGEAITQIYSDPTTGEVVIVLENGRGATFRVVKHFAVRDPYAEVVF